MTCLHRDWLVDGQYPSKIHMDFCWGGPPKGDMLNVQGCTVLVAI